MRNGNVQNMKDVLPCTEVSHEQSVSFDIYAHVVFYQFQTFRITPRGLPDLCMLEDNEFGNRKASTKQFTEIATLGMK